MLFNSYEFIFIFLPITFYLYFYLNRKRLTIASKNFLVLASLFFYSWWNILYLPLILISILFNYIIGTILSKNNHYQKFRFLKKNILIFGIVLNISLLCYYKYSDFFIQNLNFIFNKDISLLHLALPLAISFFTFQQISYLVDSYRGEIKEYSFLNYILFVTFFPQLIAGPIVHHKEMLPQFSKIRNKVINYSNIAKGLFIFSIGLFKKVIIADTFAIWATQGFDVATKLNLFEAWATSFSYTFQLYFDFSGYTDMAIGVALLFNIILPINFNSPYKALNIQDFWRRWHITLSRFLKDYVYIPLGGNRQGEFRTYVNLFFTFLIGGIWHGAGWTFVFWGFLHGLAIIIHRIWNKLNFKMWSWLAWFLTFNFINITWIFFRAKNWNSGLKVLKNMFNLSNIALPSFLSSKLYFLHSFGVSFGGFISDLSIRGKDERDIVFWLLLGFLLVLCFKNSMEKLSCFKPSWYNIIFISVLLFYVFISMDVESEFLYFNF